MFPSELEYEAGQRLATTDRRSEVGGLRLVPATGNASNALVKITQGLLELASADPHELDDEELATALATVVEAQTRLAAQEARIIERFDAREVYQEDACVGTTGWLRYRTTLSYPAAQRRVKRARLLRDMPGLRAALVEAATTTDHVDAVVRRATPQRRHDIAEHDATLAALAVEGNPLEMSRAVQAIIDHLDADEGPDEPKPCRNEDLREVKVAHGFDGLGVLDGATTPVLTELLLRVRDVYSQPDPPDTPIDERRTAAQRFHDALRDALTVALDHHPGSAIGGVKTHIVLFADLYTLLGQDELARIAPRLASSGFVDPEVARHLIATTNGTLRAVLGLGPWNPVAVGRAHRVLPDWLRTAAQMSHVHCRGVGCDRPFAWTEADHLHDWAKGGETALENNAPLCSAHHDLKQKGGWTMRFDTRTGEVTWTSRDRQKRIKVPPPDLRPSATPISMGHQVWLSV